MKQFNEKPSKYSNLGEDIKGAKRHNFDTYESTAEREVRERKARAKKSAIDLKRIAMESMNESNFAHVIAEYEFKKALPCFPEFDQAAPYSAEMIAALKAHVVSSRQLPEFSAMAKAFNRLLRLLSRIKWKVRSFEDAQKYFEKRKVESFTEFNGVNRQWQLTTKFNAETIAYLGANVKAVQFGNSLPESEREYCLQNLAESIKILEKYLNFDFKTIGFSYGARGMARSIAHYQDAHKVLAFNRSWDGALIHELGHAIDYQLGMASWRLPDGIARRYRAKLNLHEVKNLKYYMNRKEIFARLFEVFMRSIAPEMSGFMQTTFDSCVMPDLDAEAIEFMGSALKTILRGES